MKESACYIHIPFCDHKCIYCDFYSIITTDNVNSYLNALFKEIDYYSEKYSSTHSFNTIYFGGGTPSFMEPDYIAKIIAYIKQKFTVSDYAEISLETNPGTVDRTKLKNFFEAGINRISIGIQSFDPDELKFLTRIHDKETAITTVESAYSAGLENISVDLIFNLPNQSKEKWQTNLETAVSLPIKHISAYSLILEQGTILNKMVLDGKVKMQSEDYDADLYEFTIDFLCKHEFRQYEVSNFAKDGYQCVHNNAYWRYKDYLSLGTSAHSFMNGERWWNYSSLKMFIAAVENQNNGRVNGERINRLEMIEEYTMLALRSYGLDTLEFIKLFGNDWLEKNSEYINRLIEDGFFIRKNNFIKFTPRGYAVCDEILLNFT
ncbi:MAG: radical SAM family heme chaperone HemW [Melioribacteraceae bacterium]|nr:radical SAM family heme chaperone HemW [Melioribacteraceae bacterium]MCF8356522.1 radical SAM family heme chaperone HemW [Melioribacteraceae bacterium]MCF8395911.1 radical SAM family heme chaperone HemW [Melioribacteraceae bacterium]MCF8420982.1 radical SAM family heme chaperone HemW [Melioribacteraceae bacterium]